MSVPRIKDSHRDDDEAVGSGIAGITALRRDETHTKRERRRTGKNRRINVANVLYIFSLKKIWRQGKHIISVRRIKHIQKSLTIFPKNR